MRPPARTVVAVIVAAVLTGAAAYAGGLWGSDPTFGRGIFPVAFAAQAAWSAAWRLLLGGWIRQQRERIRWLVIGTGEPAVSLHADFEHSQSQGELLFLDEQSGRPSAELPAPAGTLDDLERVAKDVISGVVIALPEAVPEPLVHRLMTLRFSGVRVYGLADFYEQLWFKVPVLHTRGGWLLFAHGFDLLHNPLGLRVKRLLDVIFALTLLVGTSPVMALVALLVKLDSRGPVIYRQTRTGLDGQEFEILKFRSMTHDAERDGPQWTQKSDPRTTRVGRVIRLLRLDELPQLVNVLKGDMSIVGPRPERPFFVEQFKHRIPQYMLRHKVKSGITGWAQVNGWRGNTSLEKRIEFDLYYIENWSLLLDLKILILTLFRGFGQPHAY
jgi:exopolysaccharide biosynthesis polyprenyl glycosylphosphotransferase